MSHEISIRSDGFAEAFFAGNGRELKPAWHNLGQAIIDDGADSEKAMELSGLSDWMVLLSELKLENGQTVPDMFATYRSDTGAPLGVVSDRYKVVQNRFAFKWLDSLVSNGEMKYESAGALQGGKKIWILGRLPSVDEIAPGDNSLRYILFSSSHDGKTGINALPTATRVVCANTLRIALQGHGKGIRHTGDVRGKLDDAKRYLSQFDSGFELFRDKARILAQRQFTQAQAQDYINELFPDKIDGQAIEGRALAQRDRKINEIRDKFRNPRNNGLKAIAGTWWALYNSVSEFVDHPEHKRTKREARDAAETKFLNVIDGQGADMKNRAFDLAVTMAS